MSIDGSDQILVKVDIAMLVQRDWICQIFLVSFVCHTYSCCMTVPSNLILNVIKLIFISESRQSLNVKQFRKITYLKRIFHIYIYHFQDESRKTQQPKHCDYNNKDEENILNVNTVNNDDSSLQKFKQKVNHS